MKTELVSQPWLKAFVLLLMLAPTVAPGAWTQVSGPTISVPNLAVRPAVSGLVTPIGIVFISNMQWLVIEKNTGRVQVVDDGTVAGTALDLAVNNASERGLLGIALHPDFDSNHFVYLFWSCIAPAPSLGNQFFPTETECAPTPELGADSDDLLATPLLGNRVDRFVWDSSTETLTFDSNLIQLRSFQNDAMTSPVGPKGEAQPPRANHDGGVIRCGPDGNLYIMFGDAGRRGQLQNLRSGPTATGLGPEVEDDQFPGGPQPDDAHFTGVIIRLNDDGSTPTDNPFFAVGASMGGEVGQNIQKIFAYGIRNSFGMAFDPLSGHLWDQENGEDAFDEINLVEPGFNSGWIQVLGPSTRVAQFKQIETTALHHEDFPNLQQFRWGPERIANTAEAALSRLFILPGSHYSEPEYSWVHVLAPAAIGFLNSAALGPQWFGDLFVGFSLGAGHDPLGGGLMAFELTGNRRRIAGDLVADNTDFHDPGANQPHIVGRNFGILTDIQTGPNGNLLLVSLDKGTVYEVFRSTDAPQGLGRAPAGGRRRN
jgi:aldose sugar dehydrogenase